MDRGMPNEGKNGSEGEGKMHGSRKEGGNTVQSEAGLVGGVVITKAEEIVGGVEKTRWGR
jgi:hypothetical protein